MKQTAPRSVFGKLTTGSGVWDGDVNSALEQERHLRMADFVGIATGQDDAKRLKRPMAQAFFQSASAHSSNIWAPEADCYAAGRRIERQGMAARPLSD
jgi:hypothetical protein